MAPDRQLPDRRTVLRVGGGMVVLAVGIGAGIIELRGGDDAPESGRPDRPAGVMTTSTAPPTTSSTTSSAPPTTSVAPLVPDQVAPGVLAIGSAYLAERPDESELAALMSFLPSPDGDVVAAARATISSDFARGDTVVLDGWVLAVSEARAAAVLALACAGSC